VVVEAAEAVEAIVGVVVQAAAMDMEMEAVAVAEQQEAMATGLDHHLPQVYSEIRS
jgi:hypothetical protein